MRTCDFCHAELPDHALFCSSCGQVWSAKTPSFSSTQNAPSGPVDDARTALMPDNASKDDYSPSFLTSSPQRIEDIPTQIEQGPLPEAEDEEEKNRRLVFFSRIFPEAAASQQANAPISSQQAPSQTRPTLAPLQCELAFPRKTKPSPCLSLHRHLISITQEGISLSKTLFYSHNYSHSLHNNLQHKTYTLPLSRSTTCPTHQLILLRQTTRLTRHLSIICFSSRLNHVNGVHLKAAL